MLKQGADPNSVRSGGRTALQLAASKGHVKVMRLLIDHGADVNARASGDPRFTPLAEAAASREPEAVKMLLDAGAKPEGFPLGRACWLGRQETAKLLLDAGVNPDAGLSEAALGGHVELMRLLLDRGANVNAKSEGGHTALHNAALQGGLKAVELLLQSGADPNIANDDGETPLPRAISGDGDIERVKALVKAGARLDLANKEGLTPVRMAALRGRTPVYEWLLAASGGKEPTAAREPIPGKAVQTTRELVAELVSAKPQDRRAVQGQLALRGDDAMSEVLRSIEVGTPIEHFYDLFAALGDKAAAALPLIYAQLGNKDHVFIAVITIDRIKPGAFAELPEATKKPAAETLVESIINAEPGMMTSYGNDVLAHIGQPAAPSLLRLLRHPNSEHRRRAVGALYRAKFSDDQITAELLKLLRDDDLHVRAAAARALGLFGEPTADVRAALLASLKNPPAYDYFDIEQKNAKEFHDWKVVAEQAASSLGRFGPEVIDDLLPLLTPLDRPARLPALAALVSLGARGVPRLIELMAHEDKSVAVSASVALNRIGAPAAPALAETIRTGNEQVVDHAASALWWMSGAGKAALPTLHEVAGDAERSDLTRALAARAALKVDPAGSPKSDAILTAIPALIRVLESGRFKHRGFAAEALRGIGPPAKDARPALRRQLELPGPGVDTNGYDPTFVQREAQQAIAAIESPPEDVKPK
jgi:ankyrin repeat protein/HEAT repeat protein